MNKRKKEMEKVQD
uniref:Uncharacterized protein n=1 Tax=Rhizophora mucronata TaxID=61149 RepID=A0A2P2PHS2_RHIMU